MLELLSLPEVALVREIASQRRYEVILVGGALRDALLGQPIHDLDFAVQSDSRGTVALARVVADRLRGAFYLMDSERGTARVIVGLANQPHLNLDFAACRGESWNEDLFARDFSVNAIALDIASGVLLDPTGGQADLAAGIVRQVTPHALSDDPVRALRAVRLEQALGAVIEPATLASVRTAAPLLHVPSVERVRDELMKILALSTAARAIRRLDALNLLRELVPEIDAMRECTQSSPHRFTVLEHTFAVLDYLDELIHTLTSDAENVPEWLREFDIAPQDRAALRQQLLTETSNERTRLSVFRLAALLHDIAKPAQRSVGDDGRIHFYGHEEAGAGVAAERATALRLSSDEVDFVRTIVRNHMRPNQMSRHDHLTDITARALYRYFAATADSAVEIALFCMADGMGKAGAESSPADIRRREKIAALLIRSYYERFSPQASPKPLINGRDVMGLGVSQGLLVGKVLNAVREAQMVGEISTYKAALAMAQQLIIAAGLDSTVNG
ncbi:MAG TPA: HD domain-containing protein [Anaerolineae bacterium]